MELSLAKELNDFLLFLQTIARVGIYTGLIFGGMIAVHIMSRERKSKKD